MSKNNREIIEALYEAIGHRYVNIILALISPEIVITQSAALPWGGRYHGYEGLQRFLTLLLGHVDSNIHIERVVDAGENVVVMGRTKGTVRATGKTFDVPIAHVWRIENGKLTEFTPYIENARMLDALKKPARSAETVADHEGPLSLRE